ncbi:hypothetical protein J6590_059961 [Homalodisca vitripennis]|nr:hypothetical protein J6590_059961 [Homalodisca vitripennis]
MHPHIEILSPLGYFYQPMLRRELYKACQIIQEELKRPKDEERCCHHQIHKASMHHLDAVAYPTFSPGQVNSQPILYCSTAHHLGVKRSHRSVIRPASLSAYLDRFTTHLYVTLFQRTFLGGYCRNIIAAVKHIRQRVDSIGTCSSYLVTWIAGWRRLSDKTLVSELTNHGSELPRTISWRLR